MSPRRFIMSAKSERASSVGGLLAGCEATKASVWRRPVTLARSATVEGCDVCAMYRNEQAVARRRRARCGLAAYKAHTRAGLSLGLEVAATGGLRTNEERAGRRKASAELPTLDVHFSSE